MTVECRLNVAEFLAAQRLHFRPKPIVRKCLYAMMAALAVMFLLEAWILVVEGARPRGWWVLPSGLAYGVVLFFFVLPWRVKRVFNSQPTLSEPTRTTLDKDGLLLETPRGQLRLKWAVIKGWKRNDRTLLVYHSGSLFHIFPRASFSRPEDYTFAQAVLQKHLGPPLP